MKTWRTGPWRTGQIPTPISPLKKLCISETVLLLRFNVGTNPKNNKIITSAWRIHVRKNFFQKLVTDGTNCGWTPSKSWKQIFSLRFIKLSVWIRRYIYTEMFTNMIGIVNMALRNLHLLANQFSGKFYRFCKKK